MNTFCASIPLCTCVLIKDFARVQAKNILFLDYLRHDPLNKINSHFHTIYYIKQEMLIL